MREGCQILRWNILCFRQIFSWNILYLCQISICKVKPKEWRLWNWKTDVLMPDFLKVMENDDMNMMSGEVNASTLLDFFNQLTSKSSSSLESLPIKVVQPWSSSLYICIFWINVVPLYLKLFVRKWKTGGAPLWGRPAGATKGSPKER